MEQFPRREKIVDCRRFFLLIFAHGRKKFPTSTVMIRFYVFVNRSN